MEVKKLSWGETIHIRHKVLWPQEKPEFCIVEGDPDALHYGVFVATQLVCVASIYHQENTARLRKFATLKEFQKKGIGSYLLRFMINELKTSGTPLLWLDARESAVDFYKRFGFQVVGQRFFKSDIPYFKMSSNLL